MAGPQLLLLRSRVSVGFASRWRYAQQAYTTPPSFGPASSIMGGVQTPVASSVNKLWQHSRSLATPRTNSADRYLLEVLKSEIEHELHEEADKKGLLKGSAGPFELVDTPGIEVIILKRSLGKEQIALTCLRENEYPEDSQEEKLNQDEEENEDDEAEEEKAIETLQVSVTVTKDVRLPAVEFECSYARGASEVTIESVAYLNEASSREGDDDAKEQNAYEGPDFSDLDENLQRAFHDLLKARGVTPKVCTYALDYLSKKEHQEYMRWLHNIETFFSSD